MTETETTKPGSGRGLSIALATVRLSPAGGREQQCLALAGELARRGHDVSVAAAGLPGDLPSGVRAIELAPRGWTSHGRLAAFAADARKRLGERFDRTVVFHLVPGFDVIFCTDPPRGPARGWRSLSPRYRTFAALEAAAFAPAAGSLVLALAAPQLAAIGAAYALAPARGVVLPPAVDRARLDPAAAPRSLSRAPPVLLWVGLAPRTKGLDRAIGALASAPGARLVVCGLAREDRKAAPALRLAARLGVGERIEWPGFLAGEALKAAFARADLLVHPARADVTGNVIVEALINGLPAVVSEVCGFAEHVRRADAGVVLPAPFRQADLDRALADADPATRARWSCNGIDYGRAADVFGGIAAAADLIERWEPR
jgi:UDP-glucose:(heptosyl)LPS alpha-1,3-glucosyltransferase